MNKWIKQKIIAFILAIALISIVGVSNTYAIEYWCQIWQSFSATSGEALAIGDVVYLLSTDGEVYKADADDTTKIPAVGIIGTTAAISTDVMVVTSGILCGQTSATSGQRIFLSTTAGAIDYNGTDQGGESEQCLGFVMPGSSGASTKYYIDIDFSPEPI